MREWLYALTPFIFAINSLSGIEPTPGVTTLEEKYNEPTGVIKNPGMEDYAKLWAGWLIEGAAVSDNFLKLIDAERYKESWEQLSAVSRLKLKPDGWIATLEATRKPLGSVKSRIIKQQMPSIDPKGLPKGPYMFILYDTSFTKSSDSGELVTLRREDNGQWKVLTYQVVGGRL